MAEFSSGFEEDELTWVTSMEQEKEGQVMTSELDSRGYRRVTTRAIGIRMPRTPEDLRHRLRVLAIKFMYMRAHNISCS